MFTRKPSPNTRKPRSFRAPIRKPQMRTAGVRAKAAPSLRGRMPSSMASSLSGRIGYFNPIRSQMSTRRKR